MCNFHLNGSIEEQKNWDLIHEFIHTFVKMSTFIAHINHIKNIAGIDHVGLGAGFDGIN